MSEVAGFRVCSKCKVEKPRSEFYKCSKVKHGLESSCKACKHIPATKSRCYSIEERLDTYILKSEGCRIWQGHLNKCGYGMVRYDGSMKLAHRVIWQLRVGSIPSGMCVCHRCDTPACVNVEHLFLGTQKDNMVDMSLKCRSGSKLSKETVVDMRRMYSDGTTCAELSSKFSARYKTVWQIVTNKRWVHVE